MRFIVDVVYFPAVMSELKHKVFVVQLIKPSAAADWKPRLNVLSVHRTPKSHSFSQSWFEMDLVQMRPYPPVRLQLHQRRKPVQR